MQMKVAFLLSISLYTNCFSFNIYEDMDRCNSLIFRDILISEIRQDIRNEDYYKIQLHSNTIYEIWERLVNDETTNRPLNFIYTKDIHAPISDLIDSLKNEIEQNDKLEAALRKLIDISEAIIISV